MVTDWLLLGIKRLVSECLLHGVRSGMHGVKYGSQRSSTSNTTPPLNPETDETRWRRWRRIVEAYGRVTKILDKDAEDQVSLLITCLGIEALSVYETLPFVGEDERKDVKKTMLGHRSLVSVRNVTVRGRR